MQTLYPIIATLIISLFSFAGIVLLPFKNIKKFIPYIVSLAAGGMLGNVFIHLIPHIIEEKGSEFKPDSFIWFLVGITFFYLIETALHWHHHHNIEDSEKSHHIGVMALVGDAFHNFFDGIGVATAFAINPVVGLTTALAFIFHEIPQEIGDFAIFINSGWSRKKALFLNFITGLTAVLGAIVGSYFIEQFEFFEVPFVMITAGSLVYIALADLIPEVNKKNMHSHKTFRFRIFTFFVFGIALMYLLSTFETSLMH